MIQYIKLLKILMSRHSILASTVPHARRAQVAADKASAQALSLVVSDPGTGIGDQDSLLTFYAVSRTAHDTSVAKALQVEYDAARAKEMQVRYDEEHTDELQLLRAMAASEAEDQAQRAMAASEAEDQARRAKETVRADEEASHALALRIHTEDAMRALAKALSLDQFK